MKTGDVELHVNQTAVVDVQRFTVYLIKMSYQNTANKSSIFVRQTIDRIVFGGHFILKF